MIVRLSSRIFWAGSDLLPRDGSAALGPLADYPEPREQRSRSGRDASLHQNTSNEANPAPQTLQIVTPTIRVKPSLEIPSPPVTEPKAIPQQHVGPSIDLRLENFTTNLAPVKFEKPAAIRGAARVFSLDLPKIVKPALQRRVVVIGDCENDTDSVESSLRFVGLLGKQGKLKAKARGAHIVQTGDLMHKNAPNPAVVRYWEGLCTAAEAADCSMHIVAGNHELEIWRRLQSGNRLNLSRSEQRAVRRLIRSTKLFHVEGAMLFIHGYPTVKLLRHMQAYVIGTAQSLDDYNQDCFQEAFNDAKLLAKYAYPQRNASRGSLLHDVPDPARYYRRHGREVAALLSAFGIDLVVHGHRPQRSGVQIDYELQRWLPGIRMISNDIQMRLQGLGATVIRKEEGGPMDLLFVNRNTATSAHRADVRRVLRSAGRPVQDQPVLKNRVLDWQMPGLVSNSDLMASGLAAVG